MGKYIDKDALITEIERKLKDINLNYVSVGSHPSVSDTNKKLQDGISKNLQNLLSFINTLEVKEADLNEEIEKCLKNHNMLAVGKKDFIDIAKHFFEVGMTVSNKV